MNEVDRYNATPGAIALQSDGGEWKVRKVFFEPLK
jgi:hypothetical protein